MTAEIALLNKQGLVLAADSAVTIGEGKVYNSARKMFTLSSEHSIGMMVFGAAVFMGVPWEVIINRFSNHIGKKLLPSTDSYAEELITFLKKDKTLHDEGFQNVYVYNYSKELAVIAFKEISTIIDEQIAQGKVVEVEFIIENLQTALSNIKLIAENNEKELLLEENVFVDKFKELIYHGLNEISSIKEVTDAIFPLFLSVFYEAFISNLDISGYSGIVIAGYGEDEIFPSVISYKLKAIIMENLKYSLYKKVRIGYLPGEETRTSSIMPFAQEDVISTVITGIAPEINNVLFERLEALEGIDEKSKDDLFMELTRIQQEYFINPMLNTIEILPINELAEVAETLINLTGFKRKYTSDVATVGGPIDVLSITNAEGPIWIKRKHYFDINNNLAYKIRKES